MHIKIYRKKKKMEVFIMTSVHYYHYLARLKFCFSQKNYLNQSFIFFNLAYAPSMSIIWDEYGKETKKLLLLYLDRYSSLETYSCLFATSLRSRSVSVTIRIILLTRSGRSNNKISSRHIRIEKLVIS